MVALQERIAAAVDAELSRRDPSGARLSGLDTDHVAALAANAILDAAGIWTDHLGAFYDVEGVRNLLGGGRPVSRQAVSKRRGLLALRTGSGRVVYPAFQFRGHQPAPGLQRVLAALPESLVSEWTVASWLVSAEAELNGERPIDLLFDGGIPGVAAVETAAKHWAHSLAA